MGNRSQTNVSVTTYMETLVEAYASYDENVAPCFQAEICERNICFPDYGSRSVLSLIAGLWLR